MDEDKQLFTPETVDDEIDQLINTGSSIFSDPDTRLVHELRHVYKEEADSLKRVWERLERYSMQSLPQELQTGERLAGERQIFPYKNRRGNARYPARQLLTVLAASIIGIFIVGSLALVLTVTHPGGPGAANLSGASSNPYSPFSGKLALNDPLSDNSKGYGWQETSDPAGGSCQFKGNAYHVVSQQYYVPCHETLQASNFTLEVDMQILRGNCGGLSLRDTTSTAHAYNFEVCQDGSYRLNRFDNFQNELVVASGFSGDIVRGLGQTNVVAVVANGSTFDLYVNHQKINTVNDSSYSQGLFGVAAFLNTEVAYTNARMWTL